MLDTIVAHRAADEANSGSLKPVYVRDVAEVEFGYQKKRGFVRSLGYPSIAINAIRQSNANVVSVMEDLRERLEDVRRDILANRRRGWSAPGRTRSTRRPRTSIRRSTW